MSPLELIQESMIPNDRIKRLRISLMQFLAMGQNFRTEDHYINEQLVNQLYQDTQPIYMKTWVSFYEQLDEFYEACLLNKIDYESIRFFMHER